jgi:hypothetical protein
MGLENFEKPPLISIVLDIPKHYDLSSLKSKIIEYLAKSNISTRLYFSKLNDAEIPLDQGQSVYKVVNYSLDDTRGFYNFIYAVELMGNNREYCDKYVFLITDCYENKNKLFYNRGVYLNKINGYGININVLFMPNCDMESFCENSFKIEAIDELMNFLPKKEIYEADN